MGGVFYTTPKPCFPQQEISATLLPELDYAALYQSKVPLDYFIVGRREERATMDPPTSSALVCRTLSHVATSAQLRST